MADRKHFWIVSQDPDTHKPYLIYGCPAREGEESARQKGMEMLPGVDFQIRELPTKDLNRASSMIRGKRLETTHSLKKAGQRLGHGKTVLRDRKRKKRHELKIEAY